MELSELIRHSELVVLCAASNAGTKHLIGAKQLKLFKKDSVLINVARAALVDTHALVARLKKNDMFAAVDVFDKEPLEKNAALRKLPNAFLTPHRAGGLYESVERIIGYLVDDLEAHWAGLPRKHPLTENMIPALDAW
jgi:phosphoglycerate dehydrogenase-like enzyme